MALAKSELIFDLKRNHAGKIKIKAWNKSQIVTMGTFAALLLLTVYGFLTFDYKEISLIEAVTATLHNLKVMFLQPVLSHFTLWEAVYQIGLTMGLGLSIDHFGCSSFFGYRIICCQEFIDQEGFQLNHCGRSFCSCSANCFMGIDFCDCCRTWK